MPVNKRQRRRVNAALKLWENFTGDKGEIVGRVELPQDDTLTMIGMCDAVAYTATRDGVTESYQHEFAPSARPVLAVSSDGLRLYLLAGAFRFTERGIVDD